VTGVSVRCSVCSDPAEVGAQDARQPARGPLYSPGAARDAAGATTAAVATPNLGSGNFATFAMVYRTSSTQVGISTYKFDGTPNDAAFELAVFC
jgi:hypothetical protein